LDLRVSMTAVRVCWQIENVEKFLHHVNVTMRQKHNHKQLSLVVDRIESYDAVDAPSDECDKVSRLQTNLCFTSPWRTRSASCCFWY